MTNNTFKISDEATHCFYNAEENRWCEYKYNLAIEMFNYTVYSTDGSLEKGYIGLQALTEKDSLKWEFIGCL